MQHQLCRWRDWNKLKWHFNVWLNTGGSLVIMPREHQSIVFRLFDIYTYKSNDLLLKIKGCLFIAEIEIDRYIATIVNIHTTRASAKYLHESLLWALHRSMEPRSKRPIDGAILNQAKEDQMQKHSILQVYIVHDNDPISISYFYFVWLSKMDTWTHNFTLLSHVKYMWFQFSVFIGSHTGNLKIWSLFRFRVKRCAFTTAWLDSSWSWVSEKSDWICLSVSNWFLLLQVLQVQLGTLTPASQRTWCDRVIWSEY